MTIALVTTTLTAPALGSLWGGSWLERLELARSGAAERRRVRPAASGCSRRRVRLVDLEVLEPLSLAECDRLCSGDPCQYRRRGGHKAGDCRPSTLPARNAESVADLVLGLTLSVLRHIAHTHHLIVVAVC